MGFVASPKPVASENKRLVFVISTTSDGTMIFDALPSASAISASNFLSSITDASAQTDLSCFKPSASDCFARIIAFASPSARAILASRSPSA